MLREVNPLPLCRSVATLLTASMLLVHTGSVAGASCVGDCDGDGRVRVHELTTAVLIVLGEAESPACASLGEDPVVATLVGAVRNALDGCPANAAEIFVSSVLPKMIGTFQMGLSMPAGLGEGAPIPCGIGGQGTVACRPLGDGVRWSIELRACSGGFVGIDVGTIDGTMMIDTFGECYEDVPANSAQVVFNGEIDDGGVAVVYSSIVGGEVDALGATRGFVGGTFSADCLGAELEVTSTVVELAPGGNYLSGGSVQLGLQESSDFVSSHEVFFLPGGLEVDVGADGTVDTAFTGCEDPLLQRCVH